MSLELNSEVESHLMVPLALAAGKGKAQTFAQYQRVSNLRDSIRDYVQDVEIPDAIKAKADAAGELMRSLDIMYAE